MIIFAFFFFFAVSGFYAECPSKKICFNVHIWTKSKFYGMSIGVVNHGEGEGNLDCSMHALQVCVARAAGTAHPTPRQNVCACANFGTSGCTCGFGCPN